MRLLSVLFALYFACLACRSCADAAPVGSAPTATTVAAATHSDCHGDALGDWCSPLCQCHCCGTAVMPLPAAPVVAQSAMLRWYADPQHPALVAGPPTSAAGAVWQPPRV
ncbi:DUF6660 family protein [Hymenobacter persicinus]|uniref:DUF2946 domain-containing protein n=1 Tax=Hymenobacter persicinus TaxID=2025506 RepID=A0A4Q5LB83_9BACT|nr:DUF6660 family protein [Hymenobacter persicinus]RYU79555.1 hypothetical protein EWM57_10335 [Hymenobacter persicinus]